MKYLIFLLAFNLYGQTRIEIFEGEKHIYGKVGKDLNLEAFKVQASKDGIDINKPSYNFLVTDMKAQQKENKDRVDALNAEFEALPLLIDTIGDPKVKNALNVILKRLKGY